MRRRAIFACTVLAVALVASLTSATAAGGGTGFLTSRPSMLTPVKAGVTVQPLLTVGDSLPGGIRFEAIPDGISLRRIPGGRAEVFVNHETSKVPFPFNTAAPTSANGESDFDNSQVTKLIVNTSTGGTRKASFAIPSSAGYQRFCSNYLATTKEGFDRDILFTNEESPDYVLRQEDSWPPALNDPAQEENGVVVALDVKKGTYHSIYGMGRHNHEISLPMPSFDELAVLSGDDTFTSGPLMVPPGGAVSGSVPAQSELYSYIAPDTDSLLADEGDLYAFVSDNPAVDDYYDFTPGSALSVSGRFIQVPKNIATGKNADGSEIMAEDVGYPEPPNDGSWQRDLRIKTPTGIDGPQWVLQYWAVQNNVFEFVRVEDIAYDKRAGMGNVAYVVDSGRGTAPAAAPFSGPGISTNGRVWKMVFDPNHPTVVTSMTVFVEGDDQPVKTPTEVHQPDNIESTQTGLLITEDPGSSQQFTAAQQTSDAGRATTARLMYVAFANPVVPEVVARVDQSTDNGSTDVDARPAGNWGAWESSGIVDASAAFGPGAYLIDVQAHTLWVESAPGEDTYIDPPPPDPTDNPDFMYKREGGQLLLIRIPGI